MRFHGFCREKKKSEREKRGGEKAAEDPEHWQSSRRYDKGARIGSSVLVRSLAPHGRIDRFKGILEGPDFLV